MKNIFVYGTLKKGYHNHRLLEGAELLYSDWIASGFKLFESGIPYMKRTGISSDLVRGEVYAVNEKRLQNLDSLEGHPNWYRREVLEPEAGDIEGYVYLPSVSCPESPKVNGVYVYGRRPI